MAPPSPRFGCTAGGETDVGTYSGAGTGETPFSGTGTGGEDESEAFTRRSGGSRNVSSGKHGPTDGTVGCKRLRWLGVGSSGASEGRFKEAATSCEGGARRPDTPRGAVEGDGIRLWSVVGDGCNVMNEYEDCASARASDGRAAQCLASSDPPRGATTGEVVERASAHRVAVEGGAEPRSCGEGERVMGMISVHSGTQRGKGGGSMVFEKGAGAGKLGGRELSRGNGKEVMEANGGRESSQLLTPTNRERGRASLASLAPPPRPTSSIFAGPFFDSAAAEVCARGRVSEVGS